MVCRCVLCEFEKKTVRLPHFLNGASHIVTLVQKSHSHCRYEQMAKRYVWICIVCVSLHVEVCGKCFKVKQSSVKQILLCLTLFLVQATSNLFVTVIHCWRSLHKQLIIVVVANVASTWKAATQCTQAARCYLAPTAQPSKRELMVSTVGSRQARIVDKFHH